MDKHRSALSLFAQLVRASDNWFNIFLKEPFLIIIIIHKKGVRERENGGGDSKFIQLFADHVLSLYFFQMDSNSNQKAESEQQEKEATTRSLVKEFCEYTTCGGLGRVVASRYLVFRLIWLLLVLAALGYATYQIYGLYLKYEKRPVATTIKLKNMAVSQHT